ncbi:MAG: hypothetical protein ACYC4U_15590 [Pirellulaceae bacterium]
MCHRCAEECRQMAGARV